MYAAPRHVIAEDFDEVLGVGGVQARDADSASSEPAGKRVWAIRSIL
jgi:hypothetical protein